MPRAPVYNPNQVGSAETTGARFRTPDFGPPSVAQGVAGLGKALNDYAVEEDRRDAEFDDTQARKQFTNDMTLAQGVTNEYTSLQGGNATAARKGVEESLAKARESSLAIMATPRQKRLLSERWDALYATTINTIDKHYRAQEWSERVGVLAAESGQFADSAASTDDADAKAGFIQQGRATFQEGLRLKGITDPEAVAFETKKYTDGIHTATIDRWFASPNPPIDLIRDYVEAHHDEFTAAGYSKALERLQGPLQDRNDNAKLAGLFAKIDATTPVAPSGVSDPARMHSITAQTESNNRDYVGGKLVTSPKGAQGRMQVMPGTQTDPGFGVRPAKDNSPDELARVGRDYLDAMMGRYGGDPAKAWAAYNAGPGAVDKALAKGGDWLSRLPKETRDYVGKNVAALGGTDNAPRTYDKAAIYDAIEREPGLLPEERERLKAKADKQIARDEQLLDRQYKDAGNKALQTIIGLGDNFTDVGQIPQAIRNAADPTDVMRWADAARKNKEAKAAIPKDNQRSLELQILQRADPDAFLQVDLSKEVGKVAPAELQSFVLKQAELVGNGGKEKAYNPREKIKGAISWGAKYGGVSVPDGDFPKVYDAMDAYLKGVYAKKGVLDAADYDAAFKGAVREIPRAGFFGGTMKAYDVVRVDQIPDGANATIDRTFRAANGRGPNDAERLTLYRQMLVNAGAR